ncbi:translation initiation factor [Mesonia sp. MT50]|uniref:Translation initiation factor n=1 Tax=Mesonia profundi TaxID=3070998 RepID=A0ABU1A0R3_9FLAO|nr:translation initiation factor [Mesonia profundi]MDQ7917266.1 translation initiation factor [Mesonia profundi]
MDLKDQLKDLFPDHETSEVETNEEEDQEIWLQDDPLICKYEKRKGKANTIIEGYTGADSDFKILAKELKTTLGVGGSSKNEQIIIQGDYRSEIMDILKEKGFQVKRVGG